jgi:hypothetical protein
VLEDLVRLEAALPGARQRQPLEALLVQGEADRLVPEVARRGQHDVRHQHDGGDRGGQPGEPRRPAPAGQQRHAGQDRRAQVEPEHRGDAGERARRPRAPPRQQQGGEAECEPGRVRVRDAREGHRRGHGQPGAQRQRLGRVAARERVGEHRHARVEQHPQDAPGQQRRPEQLVEPGDQEVLARAVVGVEVAVGQLPVGDPLAGLEHQALVVRVDAPADRQSGHQGAEEPERRQRRGTPASITRGNALAEPA